ncbi:hypothetical protein B0H34DRAFT_663907, partial [Crassisporium funariophilum]
ASNNDTMVAGIVRTAAKVGIVLNADWMRLRCMPHTIHLAAIKLLEAIGAISKSDLQKARSRSSSYQEIVTAPIGRNDDDNAAGQEDGSIDKNNTVIDGTGNILSAVEKVCYCFSL